MVNNETTQQLYAKFAEDVDYIQEIFTVDIDIDIFKEFAVSQLRSSTRSLGSYFTGITVGELPGMRLRDYKIIAMLGLNDDFVNTKEQNLYADLTKFDKKPWDSNAELVYNAFFMETILAASDKLYLSYLFIDQDSNEKLYPANTLLNFFDYLAYLTGTSRQLIQEHKCIKDTRYIYNTNNLIPGSVAEEYKPQKVAPKRFVTNLHAKRKIPQEVSITEFSNFLTNPLTYFFTKVYRQAKVSFAKIPESEYFTIEMGLHKYQIKNYLAEHAEESIQDITNKLSHAGMLPHSQFGILHSNDIKENIEPLLLPTKKKVIFVSHLFLDTEPKQHNIIFSDNIEFYSNNSILDNNFSSNFMKKLFVLWLKVLVCTLEMHHEISHEFKCSYNKKIYSISFKDLTQDFIQEYLHTCLDYFTDNDNLLPYTFEKDFFKIAKEKIIIDPKRENSSTYQELFAQQTEYANEYFFRLLPQIDENSDKELFKEAREYIEKIFNPLIEHAVVQGME